MSPGTSAVHLRAFRDADYPAIVELWNHVHPLRPQTAAELAREDRTLPQKYVWERIVAELEGRIVGMALYDQNPGMYHPQVFQVDVTVDPPHRSRGIGQGLHAELLRRLEPQRPIRRVGRIYADDPRAAAFADHLGYKEIKRDVNSALDLATFAPGPWLHKLDDVEAQGIEFVAAHDIPVDHPRTRAHYDFFSAVRADVPRSMPATPIDFDFFVSEVVQAPDALHEASILAFDGERCIGMTQVYRSDASDELQTGLSGVDRSYRRRGIATALKVRSLLAAKALGYPSIRTDNDARNTGMLALNRALGFVERPAQVTVAWEATSPEIDAPPGRSAPA